MQNATLKGYLASYLQANFLGDHHTFHQVRTPQKNHASEDTLAHTETTDLVVVGGYDAGVGRSFSESNTNPEDAGTCLT